MSKQLNKRLDYDKDKKVRCNTHLTFLFVKNSVLLVFMTNQSVVQQLERQLQSEPKLQK